VTPSELRAQTIALAKAPRNVKRRIIEKMTWLDMLDTDAEFERWIHDGQIEPPADGWRTWLMMAGRGFGKTRAGAEWVEKNARSRPGVRIALVGATIDEARRVMVEGVSGVLGVAKRRRHRVKWEPSIGRLRWPYGSEAQLFSGDNPDGLRGPEHDFAWADELAKWRDPDAAWMNLQMGLRRGNRPRALVTTTPKPIEILKRIREEKWTVTTAGRTDENVNLSEGFVEMMIATTAERASGGRSWTASWSRRSRVRCGRGR
jgi:phage terminase large subunit-like protein